MHNRIKLSVVILIALLSFNSAAAQGNLGQAGASFLQIAVDPRGAALGGANTASVQGAAALYWNPGAIAGTENMDVLFAYTDWVLDTKIAYGGIVKNFRGLGSFGFSVTSLYMDKMEITTPFASEGTGLYYEAGDIALGLSYARRMTDKFSFGATVKYIHEYIWNETASQIAFDVGSIYETGFHNLRIGMSVHNISGTLKFSGDDIDDRIAEEEAIGDDANPRIERFTPEFRLPQVFHLGIAFDPLTFSDSRLTVMADADVPNDNKRRLITAMEFSFKELAFLRGSYRINYDTDDFAFGAGIKLPLMGVNSRVDYSYSSHGVLGDIHRFAIGLAL